MLHHLRCVFDYFPITAHPGVFVPYIGIYFIPEYGFTFALRIMNRFAPNHVSESQSCVSAIDQLIGFHTSHALFSHFMLQVNGFRSYVDLYVKDKLDETGVALKIVNEVANERWEVCLTMSEKGFQQISFVNSIATTKVAGNMTR